MLWQISIRALSRNPIILRYFWIDPIFLAQLYQLQEIYKKRVSKPRGGDPCNCRQVFLKGVATRFRLIQYFLTSFYKKESGKRLNENLFFRMGLLAFKQSHHCRYISSVTLFKNLLLSSFLKSITDITQVD